MKNDALALAGRYSNPTEKLNRLREYVQAFTLRSLHESEAFLCLSFVGGTALRFLYNLPRFSEDLDFSLESKENYKPSVWLSKLKRDLNFSGFEAVVTLKENKTVNDGWIKIPKILKEAGLSGNESQNLFVKIQIDTRPPAGAVLETEVVNRHFLMAIRHHDMTSLMAGKIHALISRKYLKGRDWYDLLWYRSQRPPVEPNLAFLQESINQTESKPWSANNWKDLLKKRLKEIDFKMLLKDVGPFLENPEESKLLTPEFLEKIIG